MGASLNTELKIPDIWFDFYGRLLPGFTMALGYRALALNNWSMPSATDLAFLAISGYILALFFQPVATQISSLISSCAHKFCGQEKGFKRQLQFELGIDSRQSLVFSKIHAEVNFFTQLFVQIIALIIFLNLKGVSQYLLYLLILLPILILFATEVELRSIKRAKELKKHKNDS